MVSGRVRTANEKRGYRGGAATVSRHGSRNYGRRQLPRAKRRYHTDVIQDKASREQAA